MKKGIIPHSKAKGTDICSDGKYHYIIRSDLGCYMQTTDVKRGLDISIFSLHPACQNGDHYLSSGKNSFFIIKGKSFRRVKNLMTDADAKVYSLHPNCQGGDHYFSNPDSYFYIIFQKKGTFRMITNLHEDTHALEDKLDPDCSNGLYYWGMPPRCFFLMPILDWGVEFCATSSIIKDEQFGVFSVHPDVLNFFPGGLSVTKGPASGIWENIKTITNDSTTAVTWQKKIYRKVGYNKEMSSQITHNWKVDKSCSFEFGKLPSLIAKCQFSFSTNQEVSHVSTDSWSEATEEEEQLTFELKPNESLYLWQYRLSLGQEPVLFWGDLKISNNPNPPTEDPLPVAQ